MRKVVYKWFSAWEHEKEEKWLDEMCQKGYGLESVSFCRYEFAPCEPGEYSYRLEMLDNMPSHSESVDYIKFIEETGAEQIASYLKWVYFRKKREYGDFELFSDIDSRILHMKRISRLMSIGMACEMLVALGNFSIFFANKMTINLFCALLCFAVGLFLEYGRRKLGKKTAELEKERQIFE